MPGGAKISIPFPPSVNKLWRNVNGKTLKSQLYRSWIADAGWVVNAQKPKRVDGPYYLTITANRPDRRRRDLGNLEKSVSDLLVYLGVVQDDSFAKRIVLEWSDAEPDPSAMVIVTVEAA